MRTRVALGGGLIGGAVGLAWLDSRWAAGPVVHAVVGLILVGGLLEFYALVARQGSRPLRLVAVVLAVCFVAGDYVARLSAGWGGGRGAFVGFYAWMGLAAALAVAVVAVSHLVADGPQRWAADAPATALGLFYVWFLGAHLFAIRGLGSAPRAGVGYLLVFLGVVKLGDAGAYFTGLRWGSRKLAPRTSPNKTVEGTLGGLATSVVAALALAPLFGLGASAAFWALFGLLVGIVAQAGDLVESALKRSVGVKDSGGLVPTFGGLLDVMDSPLLSAPVALWLLA